MTTKALVVLSGGQDSTTCLIHALHNYDDVHAISFYYKQRHSIELEFARKTCEDLDVSHKVVDLTALGQLTSNALTDSAIDVKAGEGGQLPSTFVDGRNLLFLSYAAIYAKSLGITDIITGVSATDYSGYPDCRDVFIKSLNVTLNLAMDYQFNLITPLMWLTKAETWRMADDLDMLDFIRDRTVTCYHGIPGDGCGECPACQLRKKGLDEFEHTIS